jgi:hypothetical protein
MNAETILMVILFWGAGIGFLVGLFRRVQYWDRTLHGMIEHDRVLDD